MCVHVHVLPCCLAHFCWVQLQNTLYEPVLWEETVNNDVKVAEAFQVTAAEGEDLSAFAWGYAGPLPLPVATLHPWEAWGQEKSKYNILNCFRIITSLRCKPECYRSYKSPR